MKRNDILKLIKSKIFKEYKKIPHWQHDLYHIRRVVREGKKLAKLEKLSSKDAFLVELACYLHDLGRNKENDGLLFLQSNHAEISYEMSKQILKPYEKNLGRESIFKILQAIREHSLPALKHPENKIAQILLDADRGSGINYLGIFTMLTYFKVVDYQIIRSDQKAKLELNNLTQIIVSQNKIEEAIIRLNYYKDWYYGNSKQQISEAKVASLYTRSAKRIYQPKIKIIEDYIDKLENFKK
ncbi:HD domain-containing protein [Candidatus Beckwithbacteria bacterium]|nr:HD domain-containing protein [Candidatus Beckwithbacteria bacterium]